MELFAADGVDAVTVRRIADAAGISERTLYRYFPSKQAILWARPRRVVSVLPKALTDRPAEEPLVDAFRQAGRQVLTVFTDEPDAWIVWARVVRDMAPTTTLMVPGNDNPYFAALAAAVSVRSGDLSDLEVGVLTVALTGTIQFALIRWVDREGAADLGALFEEAVDALALLQAPSAKAGIQIPASLG